jgi:hypothetical protein
MLANPHETAPLLQHADHLQQALPDADFPAQGRFTQEKIGGHVIANDTDRAAAGGIAGGQKPALGHIKPGGEQELFGRAI